MTLIPGQTIDAKTYVANLLQQAVTRGASDIHLEPAAQGYDVRLRIDGLLTTVETLSPTVGRAAVSRLMVIAQLLTYRQDLPQEGRLPIEMADSQTGPGRLSIMPTRHGLRAAVRLSTDARQLTLDQLGLPEHVVSLVHQFTQSDAGMMLVTGPAGSGKTTTLHAVLRYITEHQPGLSVVALEDPVERDLPGVTQIEVTPFGELTYERALRSMLRQDPQVLMLGEIRDAATASLAVQAALSGHRLLSTLHAGSPGSAVARLLEMGIEPYQITSALQLIVTQRLIRRATPDGYAGRCPIAEAATLTTPLRQAILQRADAQTLQATIESQPGHVTLAQSAQQLMASRVTTLEELQRVLGSGFQGSPSSQTSDTGNTV